VEKKGGILGNVSICIVIGLLNVLRKMQEDSLVMDLWPQSRGNTVMGVNT
jgi:hypothetical protein